MPIFGRYFYLASLANLKLQLLHRWVKFYAALALFSVPMEAFAQDLAYHTFSVKDGLPSNTVYELVQDRRGYLWIGTESGLFRYDGRRFVKAFSSALQDYGVYELGKDARGKLWFRNILGQLCTFENDTVKLDSSFIKYNIKINALKVLGDSDRLIVIDQTKQIYLYDTVKKQVSRLNRNAVDALLEKSRMVSLANGQLCTADKSHLFNSDMDACHTIPLPPSVKNGGARLLMTSKGKTYVWVVKTAFLYEYLQKEGLFVQIPINTVAGIFSMKEDRLGNVWVLCYDGLVSLGNASKRWLDGFQVNSILKDTESNYWVGTARKGLLLVPSLDATEHHSDTNEKQDDEAYTIERIGNQIWAGFQNGRVGVFSDGKWVSKQSVLRLPVLDILRLDNDETLLSGEGGICALEGGRILPELTSVKKISSLNGHLMFGTYVYLFWSKNANSWRNPNATLTNAFKPMLSRVFDIVADSSKFVSYVATDNGLYEVSADTFVEIKYQRQGGMMPCKRIALSPDGVLWAAVSRNGVYGIRNKRVDRWFPIADIIGQYNVTAIAAEKLTNTIWLGAENGLYNLDMRNGELRYKIETNGGLPSNYINYILPVDSMLWVATQEGLVSFNLNQYEINRTPPPIYITGVTVSEEGMDLRGEYVLSFDQNNLKLTFDGLCFRARGSFRYQYRLLGLDTTWRTLDGGVNFVRYPSLQAGSYVFEVIAVNENGIKSISPAMIKITILPAWWNTWWFRAVVLLFLAGLVWVAVKWMWSRRLKVAEYEAEMVRMQLSTLRAQMNPHFIFNALNSIQSYIVHENNAKASRFLSKFAQLIRLYLDFSGKDEVSLTEEIEALKAYASLEKMRFDDSLEIIFEVDERLDAANTFVPPLIIQPYLENALKHGLLHKKDNRVLKVSFESSGNQLLRCIIQDNGIGREASAKLKSQNSAHKSWGMSLARQRLELVNRNRKKPFDVLIEDLYDEAKLPVGTRVTVFIYTEMFLDS